MRKIFCILAILMLFVPAAALAQSTEAATSEPTDSGTIPDSVLYVLGDVTDHMAMACATHNYEGLDDYMMITEQQLLQAIGATDKNDVKAMVHVDLEEQTALAKVMIRPDCLDKKLKADVKVMQNDEGLYQVDIKIKGDLTELQKASVQSLVEKIKYQMPGIVVNVKYL